MAKIYGEHTCSNCGTKYNWDYHIPNKLSDHRFDVEQIILNNIHAIRLNNHNEKTFELLVNCKKCNHTDKIIYNSNND